MATFANASQDEATCIVHIDASMEQMAHEKEYTGDEHKAEEETAVETATFTPIFEEEEAIQDMRTLTPSSSCSSVQAKLSGERLSPRQFMHFAADLSSTRAIEDNTIPQKTMPQTLESGERVLETPETSDQASMRTRIAAFSSWLQWFQPTRWPRSTCFVSGIVVGWFLQAFVGQRCCQRHGIKHCQ